MTEREIFEAALGYSTAERNLFLEQACAGDAKLRQRIEGLLIRHAEAESFLEIPAVAQDVTGVFQSPPEGVGANLGPYKLLQQIGEGGMGTVYMAQQTEPVKRVVAVKVIKPGMDSEGVLARFETERQALAMMDHPNIARVLDAGSTASKRPFFVMELVKGVPITQYCDEQRLTPRQRLELFVPVCHAIQHAHQKGVIHRDIKSSNVMIALYDDRPVPKVIDFGVAKATGQALTDKTLVTGYGTIVGTPEYMSPEQANLNNMDIDTRSDIYSLGVLLYELLTGSTPMDRKQLGKAALLEILRIVREVDAPRPSIKLSTCDALPSVAAAWGTEPAKLSRMMKGELDWVLLKALDKDRARRYETANGFAADIQRYLANEAVLARPPSAVYRMQKTWQRNKLVFLTGLAIAASLVIGLAVSIWQSVRVAAALNELRATAPAFAEQAHVLAASERFDEALEKLDYAARLRPDVPEYLIAKGDLLQCQFKLAEAAKAYQCALALRSNDDRATASAELCVDLLATSVGKDGKLTREGLSKLHTVMQQQQRPAAELMPVARILGEERKLIVAYWLERLKDLPVSADKPLAQRLIVRDDGLLALDLGGTKIVDVGPLVGAPLADLNLAGATNLINIAPLRGMNLVKLSLTNTKVTDLSPLAKMKSLEKLQLNGTPVSDLSPLEGIPLRDLNLWGCPVTDISPLRHAALEKLTIVSTRITDLSPLVGMPLKHLDMVAVPVTDFTPLAKLPLELCNFAGCQLTDLSVLRGTPIRELLLWNCASARNYAALRDIKTLELLILPDTYNQLPEHEIAAIAALRHHPRLRQLGAENMQGLDHTTTRSKEAFWKDWDREQALRSNLRKSGFKFSMASHSGGTFTVWIENQPLSDLSILKGAPISQLWLNNCKIRDLTPLQEQPLRVLGMSGNPISDLTPLQKLPLEELSIEGTEVSDLSPLMGMRLKKLYLHNCNQVTDVSALAKIPTLEKLTVPVQIREFGPLRGLSSLKLLAFEIDDRPPHFPSTTTAQFWDELEQTNWLRALRVAGIKPNWQKRAHDGTWEVDLNDKGLTDLAILRGAPISLLWMNNGKVTDLTPIQDCPLRVLGLHRNPIADLTPLRKMRLTDLSLEHTNVSDLTPLVGMPLKKLLLHDCAKLTDVSILEQIPTLERLSLPLWASHIEQLRHLPNLKFLAFGISEADPGMPYSTVEQFWAELGQTQWLRTMYDAGIKPKWHRRAEDRTWEVDYSQTSLSDLSTLHGVPISVLFIYETAVSDLAPVRGMPLKKLHLYRTKVTDLSPLKGMPLEWLNLINTQVTDLSALRGMPLTTLSLNDCEKLTDVSPLAEIRTLKHVTLPQGAQNIDFLRSLPNLERLSFREDPHREYRPDKTAVEFWKEYDAKQK